MIIGCTLSADGGSGRIPIRHTHIIYDESPKTLLSYLQDKIYNCFVNGEWIGVNDMYQNLIDDILESHLSMIYDIYGNKFKDNTSVTIQLPHPF